MNQSRLWLESQASADAAISVLYLIAILVVAVVINIWIEK